jgi:ABC-type phosphate transport system substrate-binding protein
MRGVLKCLATATCGLILSLAAEAATTEVVVVVSTESAVVTLSRTELADIYLGRATRLPGGEQIIPVDQSEGNPAYSSFYITYLGRSSPQIKAHWSKLIFTGRGRPPRRVADSAAVAAIVAENPSTIGYVAPAAVDHRLRVIQIE